MMHKHDMTARVSIDIGEKTIRIIKTNWAGKIVKAATAELPSGASYVPESDYPVTLARSIKKAAKAAHIRGGNCVMIVGNPLIIVQSFTWPDMPPDALLFNAESEIIPFLPDDISLFYVSYTIMQRNTVILPDMETPVVQLEVLVSAIAKDMVEAFLLGARKAGFSPSRIDIRENSRRKLLHTANIWLPKPYHKITFSSKSSVAILDVADALVNMTVFINGVFYATRYFGSHVGLKAESTTFDDTSHKETLDSDNGYINTESLANEISSIIDFIHYRERGSQIECILISGNTTKFPELQQNISDGLDVPVLLITDSLTKAILSLKRLYVKLPDYLDAYGALIALPDESDLDLKPKKKVQYDSKQIAIQLIFALIALSVLLFAGIFFPYINMQNLKNRENQLILELGQYTISEHDVELIRQEVDTITQVLDESREFSLIYPQASVVLDAIYNVAPYATVFNNISISNGEVSISGSTNTLIKVSELIVSLRQDELFQIVRGRITNSYQSANGVVVDFEIILVLNTGMEAAE